MVGEASSRGKRVDEELKIGDRGRAVNRDLASIGRNATDLGDGRHLTDVDQTAVADSVFPVRNPIPGCLAIHEAGEARLGPAGLEDAGDVDRWGGHQYAGGRVQWGGVGTSIECQDDRSDVRACWCEEVETSFDVRPRAVNGDRRSLLIVNWNGGSVGDDHAAEAGGGVATTEVVLAEGEAAPEDDPRRERGSRGGRATGNRAQLRVRKAERMRSARRQQGVGRR